MILHDERFRTVVTIRQRNAELSYPANGTGANHHHDGEGRGPSRCPDRRPAERVPPRRVRRLVHRPARARTARTASTSVATIGA
jgi:hypothetical protein